MTDVVAHTVPDFIRRFGIGRTKLYEELNSGRLKARKVGGRTLILEADAQEWLAELPVKEPQKAA